jgi:hypothetical protein
VLVVAADGWIVAHLTDTGLIGLGGVAALGLAVYGSTLAVAFAAGRWRSEPGATVPGVVARSFPTKHRRVV